MGQAKKLKFCQLGTIATQNNGHPFRTCARSPQKLVRSSKNCKFFPIIRGIPGRTQTKWLRWHLARQEYFPRPGLNHSRNTKGSGSNYGSRLCRPVQGIRCTWEFSITGAMPSDTVGICLDYILLFYFIEQMALKIFKNRHLQGFSRDFLIYFVLRTMF